MRLLLGPAAAAATSRGGAPRGCFFGNCGRYFCPFDFCAGAPRVLHWPRASCSARSSFAAEGHGMRRPGARLRRMLSRMCLSMRGASERARSHMFTHFTSRRQNTAASGALGQSCMVCRRGPRRLALRDRRRGRAPRTASARACFFTLWDFTLSRDFFAAGGGELMAKFSIMPSLSPPSSAMTAPVPAAGGALPASPPRSG